MFPRLLAWCNVAVVVVRVAFRLVMFAVLLGVGVLAFGLVSDPPLNVSAYSLGASAK